MDRRRPAPGGVAPLALLALLVLLALAGCGSIAGEGTPEPVTPAPVPTMEPGLVPGVADDAIDRNRLVARHQSVLEGASFTVRTGYRARLPGGDTVYELRTRITRGPDGRFFYRRVEPMADRPNATVLTEVWYDGNTTLYRYTDASGSVDLFAFSHRPSVDLDRSYVYGQILSGLAVTRTAGLPDGGARVTGRLPNDASVPTAGDIESPRNASATIRVREDGLMEAIAIGYDGTYRGNRTDVRFTVGFENVNATTLEPPNWSTD